MFLGKHYSRMKACVSPYKTSSKINVRKNNIIYYTISKAINFLNILVSVDSFQRFFFFFDLVRESKSVRYYLTIVIDPTACRPWRIENVKYVFILCTPLTRFVALHSSRRRNALYGTRFE